ncbi:MAG TPA: alkaline phosphatase D family protein [Moraxellaceae bacterium]|nr:alkaline phosphatase D family protein [Moraxellaceae bacterium]
MKRRDFIRLGGLLTVSAAALGVTGCSIDGEDDPTSPFGSPTPEPIRDMPAPAPGADWQFPQSIVSADPRPDSIILWTRIAPATAAITDLTTVDAAIRLIVTTADHSGDLGSNADISASTLVADVQVPAYADFDGSVRHKLTGLSASTVYFYQFIAGTVRSNVGRFKTAQAATSTNNVKFIFMSCQDWNDNHWGAFDQIVADDTTPATPDVDFIVHLGDYIYETDSTAAVESSRHSAITLPTGQALQPPSPRKSAVTRDDYRYLYKLYRSDARIQSVHERFPMIAVWDDHEFSDDCWGAAETYTNANTAMFERRRNANRAWFEFMPADVTYSEVNPGIENIKIYRDLKFGATMHLVMTDERLYRQDHLIPESTVNPLSCAQLGRINSRYLAPEASLLSAERQKEAGAPQLTLISILGPTQRDWWKSTMKSSTSTWKVWGNEVSLLRMGLHGTNALATLIPLGIFGSLTGATGISAIPAQVSASVATQIAPGATPAIMTVVVALTPTIGQAFATNAAVAVATSAGGGGNDAAKFTAAKTALMTDGITDPTATALATAAVGAFNKALAVGNLPIVTAVTGAMGQGAATTTLAGTGAYAITAKSADPAAVIPNDLVAAGMAAGLNLAQATAATGGYLNAIAVGDITIAAAVAGAGAANANTTIAAQAAFAITAQDASPTAMTAHREGAAQAAGLTLLQAQTAVAAYEAAKAAKPAGAATQIQSASNQIAFVKAKADITTNKSASPFYLKATGPSAAAVAGFFQKFLINADQWDGYRKERTHLMNHLLDNGIQNVVAITGDIHAFFAGEVYNEFAGEVTDITTPTIATACPAYPSGTTTTAIESTASAGGTAAMVDLVVAGISSTSLFNYYKEAADGLDPTNALIGKLVYVPVAVPANAPFPAFTVNLDLLDFTLGKPLSPVTATAAGQVASQLADQIKRKLAGFGLPETGGPATLDAAVSGYIAGLAANPAFASAVGLAMQLSALGQATNPWLKHIDTEAQGYAVVTASAAAMTCQFKKLNPIVGNTAPSASRRVVSTTTATVTAGTAAVVIS